MTKPVEINLLSLENLPVGSIFAVAGGGQRGVATIVTPGWLVTRPGDPNRRDVTLLLRQLQGVGSRLFLISKGDGRPVGKAAFTIRTRDLSWLPPAGSPPEREVMAPLSANEVERALLSMLPDRVRATVSTRAHHLVERVWYDHLRNGAVAWKMSRPEWVKHAAKRISPDIDMDEYIDIDDAVRLYSHKMKNGDTLRANEALYRKQSGGLESIYAPFMVHYQAAEVSRAQALGLPVEPRVLSSYGLKTLDERNRFEAMLQEQKQQRDVLKDILSSLTTGTQKSLESAQRGWLAAVKTKDGIVFGPVRHSGRGQWRIGDHFVAASSSYRVPVVTVDEFIEAMKAYVWDPKTIPDPFIREYYRGALESAHKAR
jgi:hypothetical protein